MSAHAIDSFAMTLGPFFRSVRIVNVLTVLNLHLQVMMMGSTPVAQILLDHGADPNVGDRSTGTRPLHDAARGGFLDTVRLLVHFRAHPDARDKWDCRPVDLARDEGHTDVVDFLESL